MRLKQASNYLIVEKETETQTRKIYKMTTGYLMKVEAGTGYRQPNQWR